MFLLKRSFPESAALIDTQRLLKQCVEAGQIQNAIFRVVVVGIIEGMGCISFNIKDHSQYKSNLDLYSTVLKKLTKLDYFYILNTASGGLEIRPKQSFLKVNVVSSESDDGMCICDVSSVNLRLFKGDYTAISQTKGISTVQINRNSILLPNEECLSFGFASHPATKMWVGYFSSMRRYMTAHTSELHNRGRKYTPQAIGVLPSEEPYNLDPWWIDYVIPTHEASLLRKSFTDENTRVWYNNLIRPTDYLRFGYLWANHHPELIGSEGVCVKELCREILVVGRLPSRIMSSPNRFVGCGSMVFHYKDSSGIDKTIEFTPYQ